MLKVIFILISIALTGEAFADCIPPEPPHIPDAETTVTAEMIKAQNDVKAFMAEAEVFLKCNRNTARHNKMVDEMDAIAKKFNDSIKDFKARMKSE